MPLPPSRPDSTALVTGASSGIGTELARGLAARGHGLTLVARRADRLESLANELSSRYDVRVEAISADLSEASDRDRLANEVESRGLTVETVVNNAGFGVYEPFGHSDRARELQ